MKNTHEPQSTLLDNEGFKSVKELPMEKMERLMKELAEVQAELGYTGGTDNMINLYHEGKVGEMLGFNMLNLNKNKMDCKVDGEGLWLEVKSTTVSRAKPGGNFNDLTLAKAETFMDPRVFVAFAVWSDTNTLDYIVFGRGTALYVDMRKTVKRNKKGSRCVLTVSVPVAINKYDFDVIAVAKSKEEVLHSIQTISPKAEKAARKTIISIDEFDLTKYMDKK